MNHHGNGERPVTPRSATQQPATQQPATQRSGVMPTSTVAEEIEPREVARPAASANGNPSRCRFLVNDRASSHDGSSRSARYDFAADDAVSSLIDRYQQVRSMSERLCEGLEIEDFVVQSMPDVSPLRWHLAHTTWFFETFLLKPCADVTTSSHEAFQYLFNSYYNQVGKQFPRARRGVITRPTVREVFAYRREVDEAMLEWLAQLGASFPPAWRQLLEVGLNHEQQHQELMLTDIKHVFSCNPLYPEFRPPPMAVVDREASASWPTEWLEYAGGVCEIGHTGDRFSFDNELPRHECLLAPYRLASRLVTVGDYLAFIEDDGYRRPELWLSLGWQAVQDHQWTAPLYWEQRDGEWHQFTLHGLRPLQESLPVCHVSYFEADAYARWAGTRLATEYEWEIAADSVLDHLRQDELRRNVHQDSGADRSRANYCFQQSDGNFVEHEYWHPVESDRLLLHQELRKKQLPEQMFGDVWEWTASPYVGYPGYRPPAGAIGEYNGKFMCNQFVLRGGSCATSASHLRTTYRNFFPPDARWQFTGIRLADDSL